MDLKDVEAMCRALSAMRGKHVISEGLSDEFCNKWLHAADTLAQYHSLMTGGVLKNMQLSTVRSIDGELANARKYFPMPNPTFAALVEEVGELAAALLQLTVQKQTGKISKNGPVNDLNVAMEAIQVAVMAIRVVEEGDPSFAYLPEEGLKP